MFTGLVREIGYIRDIDESRGDLRLCIATALPGEMLCPGASIACSGCCLTVVEKVEGGFCVDVSAETRRATTIESWCVNTPVNLEPALRLGEELGGHIVTGHIDGSAKLLKCEREGDSHRIDVQAPGSLARYIAPKGSVALDGISLTVNDVEETIFGVNIVPHTWQKTTIQYLRPGDMMNLEIDILARYVGRAQEYGQKHDTAG